MNKFEDISTVIKDPIYRQDGPWVSLADSLKELSRFAGKIIFHPDFQRKNNWTDEQQINYIEYILKKGRRARDIYFNCSTWHQMGKQENIILVDGSQRLNAVQRFLNNEIPAFGTLFKNYKDSLRITSAELRFNVNDLQSNKEVLQWYIELNEGELAYDKEAIAKAKEMFEKLR